MFTTWLITLNSWCNEHRVKKPKVILLQTCYITTLSRYQPTNPSINPHIGTNNTAYKGNVVSVIKVSKDRYKMYSTSHHIANMATKRLRMLHTMPKESPKAFMLIFCMFFYLLFILYLVLFITSGSHLVPFHRMIQSLSFLHIISD